MNRVRLSHWGRVLAALAFLGVVSPAVLSAAEIRLRLVVNHDDIAVYDHVRRLERAIKNGSGSLVLVESLSDAHILLDFTAYRHSVDGEGQPLRHWFGQAKLLKRPEGMTLRNPLPERFELLAIGEDGKDEGERAAQLLEQMLSKALRPRARASSKDAI
jgi:hypothetical protein